MRSLATNFALTFDSINNHCKHHITRQLQQAFDNYIKAQTGVEIYGLYPIKVAMIIQTAMNILGFRLIILYHLASIF